MSATLELLRAAQGGGRGAGLSDEGLRRKVAAIERAVALSRPAADDPLDVLAKVGGFDIAGMCGVFLGGAACRVPVLAGGVLGYVKKNPFLAGGGHALPAPLPHK